MSRQSMASRRRQPRAAVVAAASVLALAVGAGAALPAAAPTGGARALGVSVPPDPISIAAGASSKTMIRVINQNPAPVPVTISGRSVRLGDNGKVAIGSGRDPVWGRLGNFPTRTLTVPGRGYVNVPLTIHVPRRISPDLYFLGFLVTPTSTKPGSLQVINQIGSFVTIDVPGPRLRKLAATFKVPNFVIGSQVDATLQITNVGHAAVRFWGEDDTTSTPGGSTVIQQRIDPSLLPRGRVRSFTIVSKPAWPVGEVMMTVHLIYPGRTEATTKELVFSKRVLVISPFVLIGLMFLLGSTAVLLALRLHRRARNKVTLSGAGEAPNQVG